MGRAYFIVNTMMIKTIRLTKIMTATGGKVQVEKMRALPVTRGGGGGGDYRIIFFVVFPPFSPIFYCFFQAMRKSFSRVSMLQNENNGKRSNQPEEI